MLLLLRRSTDMAAHSILALLLVTIAQACGRQLLQDVPRGYEYEGRVAFTHKLLPVAGDAAMHARLDNSSSRTSAPATHRTILVTRDGRRYSKTYVFVLCAAFTATTTGIEQPCMGAGWTPPPPRQQEASGRRASQTAASSRSRPAACCRWTPTRSTAWAAPRAARTRARRSPTPPPSPTPPSASSWARSPATPRWSARAR
jgi:hypothetical protein